MKRYLLAILILSLCAALFVSCKGNDAPEESTPADTTAPETVESTPAETDPETEPCDHDLSGGWKQDELYHWQECIKCGYYEQVEGHTDELAYVGLAPTDTEDGYGFYVCQICGRMEKQTIPAGTVIEDDVE